MKTIRELNKDAKKKHRLCGLCKGPLYFIDQIVASLQRWHCEHCDADWTVNWPAREKKEK